MQVDFRRLLRRVPKERADIGDAGTLGVRIACRRVLDKKLVRRLMLNKYV